MTEEKKTLTPKEVVDKLVPIYEEIITLTSDAKDVVTEAKDAGLDHSLLNKIAKAKAQSKLGDLEDGAQALLSMIEQLEN